MRRLAAPLAALLLVLVAAAPAQARRTVPPGFFGVMTDGVLLGRGDAQLAHEFDLMRAAGVETIRPVLYWADIQPTRDGPLHFAGTDRLFAQAALHDMAVLPVILRAPEWARIRPHNFASPPRDPHDFGAFLTDLIARYGPSGSFWTERPDVPRRPQRQWEVWNEPNLDRYWSSPRPFARPFVALMQVAHDAIKRADPGATVVLGAMGNRSWEALQEAYDAGLNGSMFDVAAVHPFTAKVRNVLKIVRLYRQVLARNHNGGKPIVISEITWPSDKGEAENPVGWETTERGQAHRLRKVFNAFERLRRPERILGVIWSTWLTPDGYGSNNSFDWSGLRKLNPHDEHAEPIDKPALRAFRRIALQAEGRR